MLQFMWVRRVRAVLLANSASAGSQPSPFGPIRQSRCCGPLTTYSIRTRCVVGLDLTYAWRTAAVTARAGREPAACARSYGPRGQTLGRR